MSIRHRTMMPKDVRECAEIIATHPVVGPRYGNAIKDLRPAWLRLLHCEAKVAAVLEEVIGSHTTICFVGVSVFVGDDFVREMKTPPLRWVGPELTTRLMREDSPLLSDKQVREANSGAGLNLVVWEGCIRPGFEQNTEIHRGILNLFVHEHRGYLWNEVHAQQIESVERLDWTLKTGGQIWNPEAGRWVESLEKDPREFIDEPHIVGITRKVEHSRPGSWVGALFDYHPPQCGFSRSEQQMLLIARDGGTDQELSQNLRVSVPTVKKMWLSIYRRVADHLPALSANQSQPDVWSVRRGKEKKRGLLAYLREHPEELRPVCRRRTPIGQIGERKSRRRLEVRL